MSVRLTPFQHHPSTVFGAAISSPAARSSLSPFPLPQYLRVVLDYRTPRAPPCRRASLPRSSSYQVPCEGRPLKLNSRTPCATSQLPKGTTSRLLSCVRWPYINALHWFLSRAALGRWFYCRMLPVRFLSASFAMACQMQTPNRLFSLSSTCAHTPHQARFSAG